MALLRSINFNGDSGHLLCLLLLLGQQETKGDVDISVKTYYLFTYDTKMRSKWSRHRSLTFETTHKNQWLSNTHTHTHKIYVNARIYGVKRIMKSEIKGSCHIIFRCATDAFSRVVIRLMFGKKGKENFREVNKAGESSNTTQNYRIK